MARRIWDLGWTHLVLRGVLAVLFGLVAMLFPLSTATALVLLWGVWALADGVVTLVQAFRSPRSPVRPALAVMGLVAIVAGTIAVTDPGLTAVTLTWVIGVWLIARGLLEGVVAVLQPGDQSRIGLFASGAVDVVLGLLFVANPGRSAVGLAWLLGLVALVWGAVLLAVGLVVRRRERTAEAMTQG
ncbi:HdeD family acid-resistance protein [Nocardioides sp.]|uniref:HdeD family acid-resistance protein n=1 Tax=Nocardioides sp. TaxID=35761 RepID=UPI0035B2DD3C